MSEPIAHARIGLEVSDPAARGEISPIVGTVERRPRRGALQPKSAREFTVYTTPQDPGTPVRADRVETVGDWFTLFLDGQEVYGAPREKVLQYTAKPAGEAA